MKCSLGFRNKITGKRNPPFSILYPLRKGFMVRERMRFIRKLHFPGMRTDFRTKYRWIAPKKCNLIWAEILVKGGVPEITFNSILLNRFIPEWVLDYVIFHEFCHIYLKDYNVDHSQEFISYMNKFGWKQEAEEWILENGKLIAIIHKEMRKLKLSGLGLEDGVSIMAEANASGG